MKLRDEEVREQLLRGLTQVRAAIMAGAPIDSCSVAYNVMGIVSLDVRFRQIQPSKLPATKRRQR